MLSSKIEELLVCDFECPYDVYAADRWDPEENPEGVICLAYAEQYDMFDVLKPKLRSFRSVTARETIYEYSYGSENCRKAMATFLERFNTQKVDANELVMTSGSSSALDILLHCVCEDGQGVMIPTPCYHNFKRATGYRNNAAFVEYASLELVAEDLQKEFDRVKEQDGIEVRAFLLTSPHNPSGRVYRDSELKELFEFCTANDLHLIVDETFLASVFGMSERGKPMCSVMDLVKTESEMKRTHVVTSLSKLGMGGLKVGCLYSHNEMLIEACRKLSWFCQISSDTQHLVCTILEDEGFMNKFLQKNHERLRIGYANAISLLEKHGIPYVEADAGVTVILDLRQTLDVPTLAASDRIFNELLHKAKVLLTKGTDMKCPEPGFYRLTFAQDRLMVSEAIQRIGKYVEDNHPGVRAACAAMRLHRAWQRSDVVFGMLTEEGFMQKPIDLRHPFIFYLGHLPAFAWNQIKAVMGAPDIHEEFDELFERGIDPDIETGECHDHSADRQRKEWPSVAEITQYRDQVRQAILDQLVPIYANEEGNPMAHNGRVVEVALEHELMHQETLLYMFHQMDRQFFSQPEGAMTSQRLEKDSVVLKNQYLNIPGGFVSLGVNTDEISWGWDNEFPRQSEEFVESFLMQKYPVTNGEFLQFVNAGGYTNQELWTESDWAWKQEWNVSKPVFWSYDAEKSKWWCQSLFDKMPLSDVLNWPVNVSQAEAKAYCKWSNARLATEAEWVRAAYGNINGPSRQYPWGNDAPTMTHGNFDFAHFSQTPVDAHPLGKSAFGVFDMMGNGWEWTGDVFEGFEGFEPNIETYQGYSADFFDGKHFVMRGGSWATDAQLLRPSFRNWFQAHYPYVFCKFRMVRGKGSSSGASSSSSSTPEGSPSSSSTSEASLHEGLSDFGGDKILNLLREGQDSGFSDQFSVDVLNGMSGEEKRVSSMYFYDDRGSEIFAAITDLEEYYPTQCETEILQNNQSTIANLLSQGGKALDLVELGAGDGKKTKILLQYLVRQANLDVAYLPIDISVGALESLQSKIRDEFAKEEMPIVCIAGDNLDGLRWVSKQHSTEDRQTVVMFLGSSIGNYDKSGAIVFLQALWHSMNNNDYLLIGFDLKKDTQKLLKAYNDSEGLTSEFNYNLLDRMNATLGSNFDREKFHHYGNYNPRSGAMESWLISTEQQDVYVSSLQKTFHFGEFEGLRTEYSFKYTMSDVAMLAKASGFKVVENIQDSRGWFVDSLWQVVKE